jgi:4,5-dihydroxyphthalate decarboxylase
MAKVELTLAVSDYDHVRDLTSGRIRPKGIDLTCLGLTIEEIFYRFTTYQEWDVSEMSFAKYLSLKSRGDKSLTAIPVFPSRVLRQSAIYLRTEAGIAGPQDLAGRKVGIPEWAQTAGIYARGWLMHQVGLDLADVTWCQAGVNQPGRIEKVPLDLPAGLGYQSYPERSLSEMLLAGDIDAAITAHPPDCFKQGDPRVARLFPDYRPVEEAYWRETGILPIMHVIAIRTAALDGRPWIAMNLFKAFEEAKQASVARAHEITASRFPIPWCYHDAARAGALFGDDYWPYGIEPNRTTLEAFLQFGFEQGISRSNVKVEDLFAKEVRTSFRV